MATIENPEISNEETKRIIQKSRPPRRRITHRRKSPALPQQEEKGLKIYTQKGVIHLKLNLDLRRRDVWIILLITGLIFLLLASSIDENIRKVWMDALLGMLQLLIFSEHKRGMYIR